jgi:putative flippase GtrA
MIRQQFVRFAIIGLLLNGVLYCAYLLLTRGLMGSPAAMTITYCTGVLAGFLLNRRVTFRYRGDNRGALLRYVACYVIGYAINFVTLWWLVQRLGLAHEVVQAGVTLILPVILFSLQRYWVFRRPRLPLSLPTRLLS